MTNVRFGWPHSFDDVAAIFDLSDERRAAKTWLPQSDKDVTEGRVILRGYEIATRIVPYPTCVKHGAMNRLSANANIWRCSECAVGCEFQPASDPDQRSPDSSRDSQ